MYNITIFTPTFNREKTLPRLYESLKEQTSHCFEWLIIDDGSTDNTSNLFNKWIKEDNGFKIRYYKTANGGKQRAINEAVKLALYDYFFIVDSDDYIDPYAIEQICSWIQQIDNNSNFAGVSGIKCHFNGNYIDGEPLFNKQTYIDATNIERRKYNLQADMAEIYKTNILKKYPFPVWHDEKFTPECIVWDAIALDGYKIRWFNSKIYYCEYLEDGLTKGGYKLYANNLMGCAMALNIKLKTTKNIKSKIINIIEILISCILKKEFKYILSIEYPITAIILFPIAWLLSFKRKKLIKINI